MRRPTWRAGTACPASATPVTPTPRRSISNGAPRRRSPRSSATLSRATLLHDVGYLESGLQSSYESIYLGDHLVSYARAFMAELPVNDETLALDEIMAVGPGGNHLARPYTRRHFREIWQSDLFDTVVYERWRARAPRACSTASASASRRCAPSPAPSSSTRSAKRRLDEILAER